MKLKLKEDPREWRKITILSVIPLMAVSTLLCCWKHKITSHAWIISLAVFAAIIFCACIKQRWFRGYYRVSNRAGFWLSQTIGMIVLALFFFFVMTPLGLVMRLFGKNALQLKRPADVETYWNESKAAGPLDRLF